MACYSSPCSTDADCGLEGSTQLECQNISGADRCVNPFCPDSTSCECNSQIIGTVYYDPTAAATLSGDDCSLVGATPTNLGTPSITVTGEPNQSVAADGTFGPFIIPTGNYNIELIDSSPYRCSCPTGCTYNVDTPPGADKNFYITDLILDWFQAAGGDVHVEIGDFINITPACDPDSGELTDRNRCSVTPGIQTPDTNSTGFLSYSQGSIDTGGLATDWTITDGEQGDPYTWVQKQVLFPGFSIYNLAEPPEEGGLTYGLISAGLASLATNPAYPTVSSYTDPLGLYTPPEISNLTFAELETMLTALPNGGTITSNYGGTATHTSRGVVINTNPRTSLEDYNYLYRLFEMPLDPSDDFTHSTNGEAEPSGNTEGVYFSDGDLHINNTAWNIDGVDQDVTVFVTGDLHVHQDNLLQVTNGNFLGFIVRGDIIFYPDVGNATASTTTPSVQGVFVANGTITVQSYGAPTTDNKFIGAGIFVAHSGFSLPRMYRTVDSASYPTDYFIYRPDLVINIPEQFKKPTFYWQEITP